MNINNKVTIISGASGELGRVVSHVFYKAGATVVLVGSRLAGVESLANELGAERTLPLAANLIDPVEAEEVVATTLRHFNQVDILLNLAGGFIGNTPVSQSSVDDLDKMLNINLRTTYNLSRAAIKPMIAQKWGRIINTASRDALRGQANHSAYAMSKAAVLRLTESMADETKDYQITVNAVLPGTIDTETNRRNMPNANFANWVEPTAIAETMLFLVCDETGAINGASIPVYGRS